MAGVELMGRAIELLCRGDSSQWLDVKPVLQVTDIRQIVHSDAQAGADKERYRPLLSDGSLLQQGMLATQRNDLVRSKRLQKGSVVRLTEFVCNLVRGRMIIIIIDLDLIIDTCHLIGNPQQNLLKTTGGDDRSSTAVQASTEQSSTSGAAKLQSFLDNIGVVFSISPSSVIMRENGTETQKRVLNLKDVSGRSVELTLWGNFCNAEGQDDKNDEKKDDNAYSSSCVICLNAPIEGAFVPCGHMAGCMSCLNEIKARKLSCPVCRSRIDQVIRVYSV